MRERLDTFTEAVEDCFGFLRELGFEGPTLEERDFDLRATFESETLAVRAFSDPRDGAHGIELVRRVAGMTPESSALPYVVSAGELLAAAGMKDGRAPRPGMHRAICGDAEVLRQFDDLLRGDLTLFERAVAGRT